MTIALHATHPVEEDQVPPESAQAHVGSKSQNPEIQKLRRSCPAAVRRLVSFLVKENTIYISLEYQIQR